MARNVRRVAPRAASLWLFATALVTVVPHMAYLPLWTSGACALLFAWHLARARSDGARTDRVHRLAMLLVALAVALAVRMDFGYFFGKAPGIAMLATLLCLKLLEGNSPRDVRAGVLLAFFLQLALFFDDQTLMAALFALGGALCAAATMLALEDPEPSPWRTLRSGATLMLQALPFLIVLFMLFPRLPGPLWGMPRDAWEGMTGLSEEMAPGSIAELGLSSEIALRADFSDALPPPSQRYWRGPVLSEFDGRVWRMARNARLAQPAYAPAGPAIDYVLTVEPHNKRWLLALDFPGAASDGEVAYGSEYTLLAERPLRTRAQLALQAYPETVVGLAESPAVLDAATRLPESGSPRTRALVAELAADTDDASQILDRVLAWFSTNALTYTLAPPLLEDDPVDEFLFDARSGFCEHFSSAFVFMMRAAGVPARVVTGYQGGTVNRVDGTLVVRQSDAHAWAELWLPGRGWVRVDPTALAAPSRIESGVSAALPAGETRPLMMREGVAAEALRALRDRWEALGNAWNRNVVGYDRQRQGDLLQELGVERPDWRTLAIALGAGLGLLMLALLAWALHQRRPGDDLDRLWRRFGARLARRGLARLPSEGPIDYAERVAQALPERAREVRVIARSYARLRYGPPSANAAALTRELAQRIREFSPQ